MALGTAGGERMWTTKATPARPGAQLRPHYSWKHSNWKAAKLPWIFTKGESSPSPQPQWHGFMGGEGLSKERERERKKETVLKWARRTVVCGFSRLCDSVHLRVHLGLFIDFLDCV